MEDDRQPSVIKQICGDYFFSYKETVNTTSPDVSQCFQHTVLVWLPCLFFWLFSPCLLCDLHKSGNLPLRWGTFIIVKIVSSIILSLDAFFLLLWAVYEWKIDDRNVAPVWFIYPTILSLTTAATIVLFIACKNRGVITSGVLFIFWLLLTICGLPEFRWWIERAVDS
uniref:ABC transporter TMD0 domain-containing protein n=1 Tax=Plectus sambesii TaxID=2011161 RepID=A0A914VYP5_9BILA